MVLTEREKQVLELRIEQRKTLSEVGKILGISRERVRQIEVKVRKKMKYKELWEKFKEIG